ncbi:MULTISPECIES: TnpV protein [unclassified Ruminococcus]|uniref:TnpV protein n=1 Tax=unclassified Ruminococcus TaxID=2608920 RepID=UPI00210A7D84|nr:MULTISPECIES: TnpV protein [unclassified Ruminococcus]MCQ4022928.1 TnpV protein [Ruminococcus sp. zg-924]MCQ4115256.1 TnpV protein [Ruminococcus sp. zg-921]
MNKHITDKKTGISYTLQGDYYLPDLALPPEEEQPIGIWGQRHLRYIRQHKRLLYSNLLTSGKLNSYLADIDRQAEEMFSRLVKQMAEREGISEKLKAGNQKLWVGKMNTIREAATEVVTNDLICN